MLQIHIINKPTQGSAVVVAAVELVGNRWLTELWGRGGQAVVSSAVHSLSTSSP